jgi:hypothetical protein
VRARLAAGEAAGGRALPAEAGQRGVGGLEGVHKVRGGGSEVRTRAFGVGLLMLLLGVVRVCKGDVRLKGRRMGIMRAKAGWRRGRPGRKSKSARWK